MKKRFNNLSIYRLIATICVLQFHIFFILYNRAIPYETLLSKGVQGLTCLSGLLYSQKVIKDSKGFFLNNFKKIIIPALICLAIMMIWNLIYMLIFQDWNYLNLFLDHRLYNGSLLAQPGNYYYILYICICYLITPVLQRNDRYSILAIIGVVIFEITLGFLLGAAMIMVTYIIGYYVGKKLFNKLTNIEEKYSYRNLFIMIGLTILVTVGYILLVNVSFGEIYFLKHLQSLIMNIFSTSFGVITFFLIIYFLRWTNRYQGSAFLSFTDKISLNVYLLNQTFMCGAMNIAILVSLMWQKTILVYLFTIGFAIISYFIYFFINKLMIKKKETPILAS